MIVMVGSPASGKSTFCENYLPEYVRVDRYKLKTIEKCLNAAGDVLASGRSVVIDNSNPKKENREKFVDLAKKREVKVRCFEMLTTKDVCFHNDKQKVINKYRKLEAIKSGSIPIHTFFKYYEEPS